MKRSDQNKALKDLQELVATIQDFEQDVRHVLMRDQFSTGQLMVQWDRDDPEAAPPPQHGDPTGEEAIWQERADNIGKTISKMADSVTKWHSMAKWIRDLSSIDVEERAKRSVPDCMACGEPCLGRVYSGFDQKCYQRWTRAQRPDRMKFIALVKAEIAKTQENADDKS